MTQYPPEVLQMAYRIYRKAKDDLGCGPTGDDHSTTDLLCDNLPREAFSCVGVKGTVSDVQDIIYQAELPFRF